MRNFVYGGVVGAVAMFAVSAGGHSQQIPTASMMSEAQTSGIVSIRALEATINVAALPTQTINYVD
jgi:hypothetical protein